MLSIFHCHMHTARSPSVHLIAFLASQHLLAASYQVGAEFILTQRHFLLCGYLRLPTFCLKATRWQHIHL